jgi:Tfp pilus assembly protein PilO
MSGHTCHAFDCKKPVARRLLMCRAHWAMVPSNIQAEVLRFYQPGQEQGKVRPSQEWLRAARLAQFTVKAAETGRAFDALMRDLWRAETLEEIRAVLERAEVGDGLTLEEYDRLDGAAEAHRRRVERGAL